ncbi:hypothetical protein D3C75_992770 [compost metagenome]
MQGANFGPLSPGRAADRPVVGHRCGDPHSRLGSPGSPRTDLGTGGPHLHRSGQDAAAGPAHPAAAVGRSVVQSGRRLCAAGRCGDRRHGWLSGALESLLGVQAADRQRGNGSWRLQAAGGTRCLAGLAGAAHSAAALFTGRRHHWDRTYPAAQPSSGQTHPLWPLPRHRGLDSAAVGG